MQDDNAWGQSYNILDGEIEEQTLPDRQSVTLKAKVKSKSRNAHLESVAERPALATCRKPWC